jgi:hypothetical protein
MDGAFGDSVAPTLTEPVAVFSFFLAIVINIKTIIATICSKSPVTNS